ncbi:MAG: arsenate reductase (glutaredoxin) [Algicola sp.]|nr:arsenate reductase (glutaredoxin) [Algicola sp.]
MSVTIYHNPRCSKSRQTLQVLQDNNIEVDVVEYLKNIPDAATIESLLTKLGMTSAQQLMRNKEAIYKELNLKNANLSETQLIEAMIANPKLIERPIVVNGDKAKIGRPPEQVLELF